MGSTFAQAADPWPSGVCSFARASPYGAACRRQSADRSGGASTDLLGTDGEKVGGSVAQVDIC
jgi:hypothetical protein